MVEIYDDIFDDLYDGTDDIDDFDAFEEANGLSSAEPPPPLDQEHRPAGLEPDQDQDGEEPPSLFSPDGPSDSDREPAGDSFVEVFNDIAPVPLRREPAEPDLWDERKISQLPSPTATAGNELRGEPPPARLEKNQENQAETPSRTGSVPDEATLARTPLAHVAPRPDDRVRVPEGTALRAAPSPISPEEARSEDIPPPKRTLAARPEPDLALPVSRAGFERLPPPGSGLSAPAPALAMLPILMIAEVPRLRRFAAAMIGDEEAADQLVQSTVQQALIDPASLQDGDVGISLLALLYQRRHDTLRQQGRVLASTITRRFDRILFQRLPGADHEEIREFADGIGSLVEEDRAILLLIALENLGYQEIAPVLMMPTARVMSKLAQARERLHHDLKAGAALAAGKSVPESSVWQPSEQHPVDLDVHGYLDGELQKERIDEIEQYLDRERAAAERLVHYGVQGDLIRRLYGPLINRPFPPAMADRLQIATRQQQTRGTRARKKPIAIVLLLLIAALGAALWVFQTTVFERLPALLEDLTIDKIAAFFDRLRA